MWVTLMLALSVLLLLYPTHLLWLPAVGRFLIVSDALEPADAIVPLAGEQARAVEAALIHQQGYAEWFIVTVVPLETPAERYRYLQRIVDLAIGRGVPAASVALLEQPAATTYGEAMNVRELALERGYDSLIVVTSSWHTRRTRLIFRSVFSGTDVEIRVWPMPDDHVREEHIYRAGSWWLDDFGRSATASEYLKLAAHVVGIR